MNIHLIGLLTLTLSIATSSASAEDISLFIVTGQSNARPQYARGIDAGLRASGRWDNVVVYNSQRSGNWLSQWVASNDGDYSAGPNFTQDLWAPDGSSELQQLIESYNSESDEDSDDDDDDDNADEEYTVTIEGMFWFQGEGDTGGAHARLEYADKLVWMIEELRSVYGDFDLVITLIDWNRDLPEDLEDIGRTPEDVEKIRTQLRSAATRLDAATHDSQSYPRSDLWHVSDNDDSRGFYGVATDLGADQVRVFIESTQCLADVNNDGTLNFFDISTYIQLFQSGCP